MKLQWPTNLKWKWMKKELNKKEIKKELVLWPYIHRTCFLSRIVLSKIMKNLRVNYVLVMYFGRKSNLGCQINC